MRFLRQLAAVTAVVAVVVLSVRGQPVSSLTPGVKTAPSGAKVTPGIHLNSGRSGIPSIQLGDLLQSANLAVLGNTAEVEAAVIAAVVIIDAGRRRLRRASRLSQ